MNKFKTSKTCKKLRSVSEELILGEILLVEIRSYLSVFERDLKKNDLSLQQEIPPLRSMAEEVQVNSSTKNERGTGVRAQRERRPQLERFPVGLRQCYSTSVARGRGAENCVSSRTSARSLLLSQRFETGFVLPVATTSNSLSGSSVYTRP